MVFLMFEHPEPKTCHFCGKEWQIGQTLCFCGAYRVAKGFESKTFKQQPYNKKSGDHNGTQ